MSTKIIAIGDPHFKIDNSIETKLMSDAIIEQCQNTKPDAIVCLGDVLDRFSKIDLTPLSDAIDFLSKLQEIAPLYLIIGNHERMNNDDFCTDKHPFTSLKMWNNTHVVDYPQVHQINDHKMIFIPYVHNGRFSEAMDLLHLSSDSIKEHTLVFAHQEFKGCNMGHILSEDGDEYPEDYPLCISGHIHINQSIGNIIYPGSPIQHGYTDDDNRGILHISITSQGVDHKLISLGIKRKKLVSLTWDQFHKWEYDDQFFYKLNVTATPVEIAQISKSKRYSELKSLGVKIKLTKLREQYHPKTSHNQSTQKRSYIPMLYQRIESDANQKVWLNHILSQISQ